MRAPPSFFPSHQLFFALSTRELSTMFPANIIKEVLFQRPTSAWTPPLEAGYPPHGKMQGCTAPYVWLLAGTLACRLSGIEPYFNTSLRKTILSERNPGRGCGHYICPNLGICAMLVLPLPDAGYCRQINQTNLKITPQLLHLFSLLRGSG